MPRNAKAPLHKFWPRAARAPASATAAAAAAKAAQIEEFTCGYCQKPFTARADSAVAGQTPRCPACAAAARALFRQQILAQQQQKQQQAAQ